MEDGGRREREGTLEEEDRLAGTESMMISVSKFCNGVHQVNSPPPAKRVPLPTETESDTQCDQRPIGQLQHRRRHEDTQCDQPPTGQLRL